jgi:hypothetical protein
MKSSGKTTNIPRMLPRNVNISITEHKQTEEALNPSYAELRSQAEELSPFNRVAVGRELRMVELKKEVNELGQTITTTLAWAIERKRGEENLEHLVHGIGIGTGIGLAIVRKAGERMGGKAGGESEPGRGSRFWIELKPARTKERNA